MHKKMNFLVVVVIMCLAAGTAFLAIIAALPVINILREY